MKPTLNSLQKEVELLKERNEQVDLNKAWEISLLRKILIIGFTYVVVLFYLKALGVDRYYLHAIVPAIGFVLSTMVFSACKQLWIRHINK